MDQWLNRDSLVATRDVNLGGLPVGAAPFHKSTRVRVRPWT